jgi:hypothetical protein
MSTAVKVMRPSRQNKAARSVGLSRAAIKTRRKARLEEILKLPGFGMWKDYPGTVEDYMRKVRKPRYGLG